MQLLLSLSPRGRQLARIESRQIGQRPAAYASGGRILGRCYCNGDGPECHEAQLGAIPIAVLYVLHIIREVRLTQYILPGFDPGPGRD